MRIDLEDHMGVVWQAKRAVRTRGGQGKRQKARETLSSSLKRAMIALMTREGSVGRTPEESPFAAPTPERGNIEI